MASSVFLDGSGYIVYQPSSTEDIWSTVQSGVAFRVWTNTSHGLLLDLQLRSHGDYMLIELVDGKILVKIVLKEGNKKINKFLDTRSLHLHSSLSLPLFKRGRPNALLALFSPISASNFSLKY